MPRHTKTEPETPAPPPATFELTVGERTLTLKEPLIIQRINSKKKNASAFRIVLNMIALVSGVAIDSEVIKAITPTQAKKAHAYFALFNSAEPVPTDLPEYALKCPPYTVNGVEYDEFVLREPTLDQLDLCLTKAGNDVELACLYLISKVCNVPETVVNAMPVTAFDRAATYLTHFLGVMLAEEPSGI